MSFITDLLVALSDVVRSHLYFLSSALVATLLVIYGNSINRFFWSLIRRWHFLLRTLAFVLFCALGYGALTVYLIPLLQRFFLSFGSLWLGVVVVAVFLGIGWLAEKHSRRG